MANKNLFRNRTSGPATDTRNRAGGRAYRMEDKHALAQYGATGTFGNTYYTNAGEQLNEILRITQGVDSEFIAKTAVYSRQCGYLKDMPAFLLAVLASRGENDLLRRAFPRIIDNGRMLRNFVQIIRSGVTGRRSLGSGPKRLVQNWINNRDLDRLFRDSVGNDPSLADVVKMVHPKPGDPQRETFYAYLLGKEYDGRKLSGLARQYEAYKKNRTGEVPAVDFRQLTALDLSEAEWQGIAENAPWHMTRMNLNTFNRHGVFKSKSLTKKIADRLRNEDVIRKVKVFPYQLMAAYINATDVPREISNALQDAMELAISNVPAIAEAPIVCLDTSGSMGQSITGYRAGASSKVRCVDVAALIAATVMRTCPDATIVPFDTRVHNMRLNPRDTVITNAEKLASRCGGGTACGRALAHVNAQDIKGDLVFYVSDNESWADRHGWGYGSAATKVTEEFTKFKRRNEGAKLVCNDIVPNSTTQAHNSADVLNIGGWSDVCFKLVNQFNTGAMDGAHWIGVINQIEL